MELMFIWKVIIIFLPVVNKPRKGTQKYYFRPEIAVRLEVVYIKSFDFNILLGQSEFRWSRPRRKHCRQWRVEGKMSLQSCVHKANSVPGSVQSLQEAAGCWKGMCPGLQLHFRPAVLGELIRKFFARDCISFQLGHAFDWCTLASRDVSYEDMLDRASVVGRCLIRKKHLYWNRHTTHVRAVMGTSPNLGGWIFLSPTSPSLPKTSSARRGRSWTPRSDAPSGDNSGERFQYRPISSNKEIYLGSHPNRRLYFTIYNVQWN